VGETVRQKMLFGPHSPRNFFPTNSLPAASRHSISTPTPGEMMVARGLIDCLIGQHHGGLVFSFCIVYHGSKVII